MVGGTEGVCCRRREVCWSGNGNARAKQGDFPPGDGDRPAPPFTRDQSPCLLGSGRLVHQLPSFISVFTFLNMFLSWSPPNTPAVTTTRQNESTVKREPTQSVKFASYSEIVVKSVKSCRRKGQHCQGLPITVDSRKIFHAASNTGRRGEYSWVVTAESCATIYSARN